MKSSETHARPFEGKTAVVTGASSGVGRAIAIGLADQGASLCLVGRHVDSLKAVSRMTRSPETRVAICKADLMRDEGILECVESIRHHTGRVDMLIHSAGIISIGRFESARIEDFDAQYKLNVRAPYAMTKALLPLLRESRGQIVFINSSAGLNAKAGGAQYAATKHALKAIADSFRDEVNADGLRVMSVFLGRTASPMQTAIHRTEGKVYSPESLLQPEDVASVVINALGIPRTAEVTDIHIRPLLKT